MCIIRMGEVCEVCGAFVCGVCVMLIVWCCVLVWYVVCVVFTVCDVCGVYCIYGVCVCVCVCVRLGSVCLCVIPVCVLEGCHSHSTPSPFTPAAQPLYNSRAHTPSLEPKALSGRDVHTPQDPGAERGCGRGDPHLHSGHRGPPPVA